MFNVQCLWTQSKSNQMFNRKAIAANIYDFQFSFRINTIIIQNHYFKLTSSSWCQMFVAHWKLIKSLQAIEYYERNENKEKYGEFQVENEWLFLSSFFWIKFRYIYCSVKLNMSYNYYKIKIKNYANKTGTVIFWFVQAIDIYCVCFKSKLRISD